VWQALRLASPVMGRMRGTVEEPTGLRYVPAFLGETEEQALLDRLVRLDYSEVRMHGQVARRVVRHYGVRYEFESFGVTPGDPVPDWLSEVRERCAALLDVAGTELAEVLVTHYPPGATIGWHRDAPVFGTVVGVSLAAPCVLRFQRTAGSERRVFELALEPRSAYVLAGPARTVWQHSIPAVTADRYSVTFRTLRRTTGT
jgi:alkylated DNA repair protein (DNA oxidative demethylase)